MLGNVAAAAGVEEVRVHFWLVSHLGDGAHPLQQNIPPPPPPPAPPLLPLLQEFSYSSTSSTEFLLLFFCVTHIGRFYEQSTS